MVNILLIEDERPVALAIMRVLADAGWHVSWANDGAKGLEVAKNNNFDLLVLDVLLPHKNGWEICEELRRSDNMVPILMLSAMDELEDKVKGLKLGADDYLPKPFEVPELVARVEALLRRDKRHKSLVSRIGDLEIDRPKRQVTRAGQPIPLSRREYDLLETLASNEGCVLSKETIQQRVWTDDDTFSNTVEVFMSTLRQKVDEPFGQPLIHCIAGCGYVLQSLNA